MRRALRFLTTRLPRPAAAQAVVDGSDELVDLNTEVLVDVEGRAALDRGGGERDVDAGDELVDVDEAVVVAVADARRRRETVQGDEQLLGCRVGHDEIDRAVAVEIRKGGATERNTEVDGKVGRVGEMTGTVAGQGARHPSGEVDGDEVEESIAGHLGGK